MSLPKINIIFRSCDAVNAVHNAPRPFGLNKKTLIKACFLSLYNSLQGFNYQIIVLGDNLSSEMKDFFLKFDLELIEGTFGNDASIRETVKIAQKFNDDDWVYFCEDDYLHTQDAFQKITCLLRQRHEIQPGRIKFRQLLRKRKITLFSLPTFFKPPPVVIFPADYPDRYQFELRERNYIFATENSHWRQVSSCTFTFLMEVSEIKKHAKTLLKSSHRANDAYLSEAFFGKKTFFNKFICLSPMPSVATHMHTQTMSPIIDWNSIIQKTLKEI